MKLFQLNRVQKLTIILAVIVFLTIGGSAVVAKYLTSRNLHGTVTFTTTLAENIELVESKAERQTDGTYTLDTETEVIENNYIAMPGVDIPKDPKIVIKNKTNVDAYLFIEVVDTDLSENITYHLTENWIKVPDAEPKNNGTVYVYSIDSTPCVLDEKFTEKDIETKIEIIKDNMLYVSENMRNVNEASIKIYATMVQLLPDDEQLADIYKR